MINDENEVRLEGVVFRTPDEYDAGDGKKVMNFAVENTRNGTDSQLYNCVIWNRVLEKYRHLIIEGDFVRIKGHLQSNTLEMPDGKLFKYAKVCVDHLESEED